MKNTVYYVKPLSVALLTSLSLAFSGSVFAVAGKFQFVNGEVQVLDASGKARTARKGDAVDEGETVASGANGFAQIKMEDGGFFAVRPDTEFKIDTFKYDGKEDGSEKGIFSLIKGSLRSVTGIVGKKHKDNYKISTATSTIGIRGSGADVGHSDQLGTAVRTLFGKHTLTSAGKTIITGPGQAALAPPGEPPKFVPSFPFNTSTTGNGNGGSGDAGSSDAGGGDSQSSAPAADNAGDVAGAGNEEQVVIPIVDASGELNLTSQTSNGSPIGGSSTLPESPAGYGFEVLAPYNQTTSEFNPFDTNQPASSFAFDGDKNLAEVKYNSSAYKFSGGVAKETTYESGAYSLGRWQGGVATGSSSFNGETSGSTITLGPASLHWVVAYNPPSGVVQNKQGVSNYALAANTNPTDLSGNVGQLMPSSRITADFNSNLVDVDLAVQFQTGNSSYVSTQNKNFTVQVNDISISNNQVWQGGSSGVSCTGADCSGTYTVDIWSQFAGASAGYNTLAYGIGSSSDLVQGVAAFKEGTGVTLPTGDRYVHFISAIGDYSLLPGVSAGSSGYFVAEQDSDLSYYTQSNYNVDATSGGVVGISSTSLEVSFPNEDISDDETSLTVTSGTVNEYYATPDSSLFLARSSNITTSTGSCSICTSSDNFISAISAVGQTVEPVFVQTLTGTTTYVLAGGLKPSDARGNVGTLNSASLSANFTNQTVDYGLNITINNQTLAASASHVPILGNGFEADTGGLLSVSCSGSGCANSGYDGQLDGAFFGSYSSTIGMSYNFTPSVASDADGYNDYIHGLVALTATNTPTVATNAVGGSSGLVGSGGSAVGYYNNGSSDDVFNAFNVVDNKYFSSRVDANGNLIAWVRMDEFNSSLESYVDSSFSTRVVTRDGADAATGVVWGRWANGYSVTADIHGGDTVQFNPTQQVSFITGTQITTDAQLSALGAQNITGSYSLSPGSFPTVVNGVQSGSISSASATVNFSSQSISAFTVAGSGGSEAFSNWTVRNISATPISQFKSSGITLSGDNISGSAVGSFVGSQAQGLISTIGLQGGSDKLGGAVYMKQGSLP